ncbi:sulfite exporter TauE/SafE family protein [Amycolatopsis sp. NPDC051061]|uniref:sulfite exporter TauE/SafE family protein n=1 Tax=Amycolatopsis sp. NPDC051061 TaxID=3155042 RepID=UPI00341FDC93
MGTAAVLGFVVGVALGALGGGGSVLAVPALVYVLGQAPAQAATGSLLIVGLAAVAGVAAHHRAGQVHWRSVPGFGGAGIVGSVLGSLAAAGLPARALLVGFALVVLVAAGTTWRGAPGPRGDEAGRHPGVRVVLAGFVVGVLTGLFGVGGGFLAVPALVFALRLDMATAVGTSLVVIAVNSATALVAHLGAGAPDWSVVAPFAGAAVAGALVGQLVARHASGVLLRRAFAILLVVLGGFVFVSQLSS